MFFEGKHIEVYSDEKEPTQSSTLRYSEEFVHILYPYKHTVKVLFVWVEQKKRLPVTLNFRVENAAGGYGNLLFGIDTHINVVGFPAS